MALLIRDKTICAICREVIADGDEATLFPAFAVNESDPLIEFSDAAFHTACLSRHPNGQVALARVGEWFARTGPGKRQCNVCDKEVLEADDYVLIDHLTADDAHPLYDYNYTHLHRSCLGQWTDRAKVTKLLTVLEASGTWSGPYLKELVDLLEEAERPSHRKV